ncbi:MAG: phage portal protein [Clostridiaceae bacterium]|nr:phage portal protein [Clostridiaceae bacterium]
MNIAKKAALKVLNMSISEYNSRFLSGEPLTDSEQNVDTDTALKYSVVFACCRVLAETFASVPILLYKKNGNEREAVTDLPIYDILHNAPNEEMSHFNFSEAMMMSMNTGGNAIAQRLFNAKGELVGLYPICAEIDRDKETRKLIYKAQDGGQTRTFQRSEIFHVPGPSLDGINGLSPISYAASAIRLGLSYEQFGIQFFRNAANPSGAFSNDGELSEEAYNRLKKQLKENYTGLKNTGTPMLLEGGMKWLQFSVNPTDAQLLESKNFQIEDICRVYRVPQHLVNKLDRSTFSNIEQQALEFVVYTMLPHFKRYEECINAQLLTLEQRRQGYFWEHKIDGLLRGDSTARAAFYASGRQWGWLCINDIRRLENLPGIGPEGDKFLEPANMIEVGGNQVVAANAKVLKEIENILKERSNAN